MNTKLNQQIYLNYPFIAYYCNSYEEYLSLDIKALYGTSSRDVILGKKQSDTGEIFNATLITQNINATKEQLSTPIGNKKVLIQMYGFSEILPNDPFRYFVYSDDELRANGYELINGRYCLGGDVKDDLIVVKTTDETNLNELYQNNFRYIFDFNSNAYVKVDEATAKIKFFKGTLRNNVSLYYGDFNDRIADYSRLIYFLFKKCEHLLSPDEREIFSFVLNSTPSNAELSKIVDIEKRVLLEVFHAKAKS